MAPHFYEVSLPDNTQQSQQSQQTNIHAPPPPDVLRIFITLKNPTASAGFEPTNLGTKGQYATSRLPKPRLRIINWSSFKDLYKTTDLHGTVIGISASSLGRSCFGMSVLGTANFIVFVTVLISAGKCWQQGYLYFDTASFHVLSSTSSIVAIQLVLPYRMSLRVWITSPVIVFVVQLVARISVPCMYSIWQQSMVGYLHCR